MTLAPSGGPTAGWTLIPRPSLRAHGKGCVPAPSAGDLEWAGCAGCSEHQDFARRPQVQPATPGAHGHQAQRTGRGPGRTLSLRHKSQSQRHPAGIPSRCKHRNLQGRSTPFFIANSWGDLAQRNRVSGRFWAPNLGGGGSLEEAQARLVKRTEQPEAGVWPWRPVLGPREDPVGSRVGGRGPCPPIRGPTQASGNPAGDFTHAHRRGRRDPLPEVTSSRLRTGGAG